MQTCKVHLCGTQTTDANGGYCSYHQCERAEAAEARAAANDALMLEATQKINELRDDIDLANAHAQRLMAERDEARRELNALKRELSKAFSSGDGAYRP